MTLHLKGKYMRLFVPVILRRRGDLAAAGFRVGIAEDEWQHEHSAETYGEWDLAGDIGERPFCKLSARCGLEQWNEAPELLTDLFGALLRVLAAR
jgi:hypothetical protein